ncbi:MAG TPA: hypothetical protein VNK96_00025 [Fimbriimonadales bacterium]|nr:hypothetical protein [Fimbriimonadales bacterium]
MGAELKKTILFLSAMALFISSGCDVRISYDAVEQKDRERAETAKRMAGYNHMREPTADR